MELKASQWFDCEDLVNEISVDWSGQMLDEDQD